MTGTIHGANNADSSVAFGLTLFDMRGHML